MKTLSRAPIFLLVIFFILGIFWGKQTSGWSGLVGLPALMGIIRVSKKEKKSFSFTLERIRTLFIGLLFLGLGSILFMVSEHRTVWPDLEKYNCQESVFAGSIISPVKQNQYGQRTTVKIFACWDNESCQWSTTNGKVQLFIKPENYQKITWKDSVVFRAWLTTAYSSSLGYLDYLNRQEIFHSAYLKEIEVLSREQRLMDYPRFWQENLSDQLAKIFTDSSAVSIAQAMLLGDKGQMEKEIKAQFAVAGLSHILAISGLHVGIIFGVLTFLLSPIHFVKNGFRVKALLILVSLIVYMLITGASPAVVRAVIMLGIVLLFKLTYQRFHILNVIAISAFVQLIFDSAILFQIGFQLSYSAVLGIVLILPLIDTISHTQNLVLKPLISWVSVTLAASLATFPLVWMYFGQFPTYFVLSNILTSFLVTVLVFFGFLAVIFAYVPLLNKVLGMITEFLIQGLIFVVEQINELPYALIEAGEVKTIPILIVILQIVFAFILMLIPWIFKKKISGET
ncbi:MAG: ComEC/Rec2 family competence protein [Bacteroidia bacterium]